jgi:hypothetical protein
MHVDEGGLSQSAFSRRVSRIGLARVDPKYAYIRVGIESSVLSLRQTEILSPLLHILTKKLNNIGPEG